MNNNHYKTSDTGLATYLITEGCVILSIDYSLPRYEYSFQESPEIRLLADKYIAGKATTDPASFLRVNKKLLRIINKRCQWGED